jgi:hypothetical protein
MSVYLLREIWAESGVFTSAAVLGLTDVDALTRSMATGVARTSSPAVAATAIAVGVLANTAMKLTGLPIGARLLRQQPQDKGCVPRDLERAAHHELGKRAAQPISGCHRISQRQCCTVPRAVDLYIGESNVNRFRLAM